VRALILVVFPSLALAGQSPVLAPPGEGEGRAAFKVPDGWTDLTPGAAPSSAYEQLEPTQRAVIQNGQYAFFAADLAHKTPTFMTNVNVTLANETPNIDQRFLDWYVNELPKNPALPRGTIWRVVNARLVEINGVTCGRVSGELHLGPIVVRNLQYVVPLGDKHAFITYSTEPASFAAYEPIFDAAARATTGIAARQTPMRRVARAAVRGAIFGGLAAAIAVPLIAVFRRRKKK
jgi:hypothetical protein